jgi:hypothetical protein
VPVGKLETTLPKPLGGGNLPVTCIPQTKLPLHEEVNVRNQIYNPVTSSLIFTLLKIISEEK